MANNAVFRTVDLTSTWVPISDVPLVANVTIMQFQPAGFVVAGTYFNIRLGAETSRWPLNFDVSLSGVDLNTIEVNSTFVNTQLVVIGNTR
ncbi:MAG TPA: hypothetical protein PKN33_20625 [Phycisphaerae bacterium]|nr:hypothetical protein [Phycisphaerae bacterium]